MHTKSLPDLCDIFAIFSRDQLHYLQVQLLINHPRRTRDFLRISISPASTVHVKIEREVSSHVIIIFNISFTTISKQ